MTGCVCQRNRKVLKSSKRSGKLPTKRSSHSCSLRSLRKLCRTLQPLAQPLQPPQPLQPRWANCTPSRGVPAVSLSKTKNVPKLTSKISSSMKVTCGPGAVSHNGTSGVGPTAPVADEPPASAIDTPTTPATGTAFFRCFCFARDIVETSTLWHELSPQHCSYAFRGHLARPIRTPTGHPQELPAHGHLRSGQEVLGGNFLRLLRAVLKPRSAINRLGLPAAAINGT